MEKIILPEGWEINREKSSENEIVLKKAEVKKALTWADIQQDNSDKHVAQYYMKGNGELVFVNAASIPVLFSKNHIPSQRIAEKIRALCQMYVIADYYNRVYADNWVADWNNLNQEKWHIRWQNDYNRISIDYTYSFSDAIPHFANMDLAREAYENNKEIFQNALKP